MRLSDGTTGDTSYKDTLIGLICVSLFLVFNPFLALLLIAFLATSTRVPPVAFITSATITFTLFFYSREYGVDWYPDSTDDIPQYVALYQSNLGIDFATLFTRFFTSPGGNEPLWNLLWWILINWFNGTDSTFIFLNYITIFLSLFLALNWLSTRHSASLALLYFLLIPISFDLIVHTWRQALAAYVFLGGVGLHHIRRISSGKWLIYLSPLFHVSFLFFVGTYFIYKSLRKRNYFENKLLFIVYLVSAMLLAKIISYPVAAFFDSIGVSRIMNHFGGEAVDSTRVYLLILVYALPQLLIFCFWKLDDVNNLLLVICMSVFCLVIALPEASSLYGRMLMFSLPLLSIFLFRWQVANFSHFWVIPSLVVTICIGGLRLYFTSTTGYGPGFYLAFGHAFDPSMGAMKLLVNL